MRNANRPQEPHSDWLNPMLAKAQALILLRQLEAVAKGNHRLDWLGEMCKVMRIGLNEWEM